MATTMGLEQHMVFALLLVLAGLVAWSLAIVARTRPTPTTPLIKKTSLRPGPSDGANDHEYGTMYRE